MIVQLSQLFQFLLLSKVLLRSGGESEAQKYDLKISQKA